MLPGCGGGDGTSEGGQVTLRWSMWALDNSSDDIWREVAARVTEAHPSIRVDLQLVPFDQYFDKLQTEIAGGSPPDIMAMQMLRLPSFAVRGAMTPLTSFIDDDPDLDYEDFFPSIREGLSVKGDPYALAYDMGPWNLIYNKDLFEAAGVPAPSPTEPMTWQRFREVAEELTSPSDDQYGFVFGDIQDLESLVPWLWSGGGDYMNAEATECTLDSPESVSALEFAVGLVVGDDGVAAPVPDLANPNVFEELFFGGKVGMMLNGPWQYVNFQENADFEWDIAPMPAGEAGSVVPSIGSGFGISKDTENPEEAWRALTFITGTEPLQEMAREARLYPARLSAVPAFEDPQLPPENVETVRKILTDEVTGATATPFRLFTTWQEMSNMWARDFAPVFLGQQSLEEALDKVVPQFNELLQEHQELVARGSS